MKATYKIDPVHSSAYFIARHMMISNVRGGFSKVDGTIVYDPKNLAASTVDVVIDASTVNTRRQSAPPHFF